MLPLLWVGCCPGGCGFSHSTKLMIKARSPLPWDGSVVGRDERSRPSAWGLGACLRLGNRGWLEEAAHRDGSPYLGAGSGARAGRREQGREQGCSRCYGLAVAPEAAASAVAHYLGPGLLRVGMSVPAHPRGSWGLLASGQLRMAEATPSGRGFWERKEAFRHRPSCMGGRGRLTGDGSPYLGPGLLWVGMSPLIRVGRKKGRGASRDAHAPMDGLISHTHTPARTHPHAHADTWRINIRLNIY